MSKSLEDIGKDVVFLKKKIFALQLIAAGQFAVLLVAATPVSKMITTFDSIRIATQDSQYSLNLLPTGIHIEKQGVPVASLSAKTYDSGEGGSWDSVGLEIATNPKAIQMFSPEAYITLGKAPSGLNLGPREISFLQPFGQSSFTPTSFRLETQKHTIEAAIAEKGGAHISIMETNKLVASLGTLNNFRATQPPVFNSGALHLMDFNGNGGTFVSAVEGVFHDKGSKLK